MKLPQLTVGRRVVRVISATLRNAPDNHVGIAAPLKVEGNLLYVGHM